MDNLALRRELSQPINAFQLCPVNFLANRNNQTNCVKELCSKQNSQELISRIRHLLGSAEAFILRAYLFDFIAPLNFKRNLNLELIIRAYNYH